MKYLFLLILSANCHAMLKIAVIDTGFDMKFKDEVSLCDSDHMDFSKTSLQDTNGHGTNVAGLIANNLDKSAYCIVIIKFYSKKVNLLDSFIRALQYANSIEVDVVNLSVAGDGYNLKEGIALENLLKKSTVIVAAGNSGKSLDNACKSYPACYNKKAIVVGNEGPTSNYGGPVDIIVDGNNKTAFGKIFSGSSQSTAIVTNNLVRNLINDRANR